MSATDWSVVALARIEWHDPRVMIGVGIFGVVALCLGLSDLIRNLRRQEDKRVDDRLMGVSRAPKKSKSETDIRKSLIKKGAIAAGSGFLKRLGRFKPIDNLQKACYQADLDWHAAHLVTRLLVASVVAMFVLHVVGFSLARAVILGGSVLVMPIMYVYFMKKRRLNALIDQLPEVFDAIVAALRAGQSLPAAIRVVSEQLPEPARTEFGLVYQEQNFGVPLEDALTNMRNRLNQMDVSFFVTAVLVQKSTGGDLAEVLDNIGEIIRSRIKLFGQVRALTAEGRLSGWVLMALPPTMMLVLLFINPDYANRLLQTELGNKLLMFAGISQMFGLIMIKKIVTIDV